MTPNDFPKRRKLLKARSSIHAIRLKDSRYCFVLSKMPKAMGVSSGNIEAKTLTALSGIQGLAYAA